MYACLCMYVCVRESVCVREVPVTAGEGSRMFASIALVLLWMAVYLTSYSDCLTSFCEPLSLPYR